jgi:hypothetical protein
LAHHKEKNKNFQSSLPPPTNKSYYLWGNLEQGSLAHKKGKTLVQKLIGVPGNESQKLFSNSIIN